MPTKPSPRIQVIYQDRPNGKGHAIRQGFAAATGDIVLIQDADLEYDAADYPDLLTPIIEGRTAFVLGSRHMGPDGWKIRKFAAWQPAAGVYRTRRHPLSCFFQRAIWCAPDRRDIDVQSVPLGLSRWLGVSCNRFDFDYELLGKLIRAGFAPLEIPVSYKSRGFTEGKKIRMFRDPVTWIFAILKCRFTPLHLSTRHSRYALRNPTVAADAIEEATLTPRR